jgi:uncharacterized membrane protein
MRQVGNFILKAVIAGAVVVAPIYLAILVLVKVANSLVALLRPIASSLPDWMPAENVMSILLAFIVFFLTGVAVRTPIARATLEGLEKAVFQRIPGYALVRSLTHRVAGQSADSAWQAALVEIEEALVPAFIIEELDDGQFTVFVPSVPTPLAGSIYILEGRRVHPLNISFTQTVRVISRWGSGGKDLVAAMKAGNKYDRVKDDREL